MHKVRVGDIVGAKRWPYISAHPDAWLKPHKGEVLDVCDPRAWTGTIAFPKGEPTKEDVILHIEKLLDLGVIVGKTPVLWSFDKVLWEIDENIRPYDEDLAEWEELRRVMRIEWENPAPVLKRG